MNIFKDARFAGAVWERLIPSGLIICIAPSEVRRGLVEFRLLTCANMRLQVILNACVQLTCCGPVGLAKAYTFPDQASECATLF